MQQVGVSANPHFIGRNRAFRGRKHYELTNHLGNVKAVVSDRLTKYSVIEAGVIPYSLPNMVSATDYDPFGMALEQREWQLSGVEAYSFSFNTQMESPEILPGHTTAMYWEYDGRIGRRWELDPVVKEWESGYACLGGNPIGQVDIKGDKSEDWVETGGQMIYDSRVEDLADAIALYGSDAKWHDWGDKYNANDGSRIELGDYGFFKRNGVELSSPDLAESSLANTDPARALAMAEAEIDQLGSAATAGLPPFLVGVGAIATTDLSIPDPFDLTVVKPVVEGVIVLGLGVYTYYLATKMEEEIDGIMRRSGGPMGVQYSLRATTALREF
jgi:hypothetical protein